MKLRMLSSLSCFKLSISMTVTSLFFFLTTYLIMFSRRAPTNWVLTAEPYVLKMTPYTSLLTHLKIIEFCPIPLPSLYLVATWPM